MRLYPETFQALLAYKDRTMILDGAGSVRVETAIWLKLRPLCGWTRVDRTVAYFADVALYIERLRLLDLDVGNLVQLWGDACTCALGHVTRYELSNMGVQYE